MMNHLICSSHTISGVMPGSTPASRHSFLDRVQGAAAVGFSGLCLHIRDYAEQAEQGYSDQALRQILQDHGILDLSLEFLTGWEKGKAALEPMAWAAAHAFGIKVLSVGAPPKSEDHPELPAAFGALCERAAEHGVQIGLEITPWSHAYDLPSAQRLLQCHPDAGLILDSWHIFRGAVPLEDIARLDPEKILQIQINDAGLDDQRPLMEQTMDRLAIGQGVFALEDFLTACLANGCTAPVAVEVISPHQADLPLGAALQMAHQPAADLLNKVFRKL